MTFAATSKGWGRRVTAGAAGLLLAATLAAGLTPASSRAAITLGLAAYTSGFTQPVAIANAGDGTGRLFVVEQGGQIRIISEAGTLLSTPFLNIHARVSCCGEQGLLGLAFHP